MAGTTDGNDQLLCSFCGKSQRQVKKLIDSYGLFRSASKGMQDPFEQAVRAGSASV